MPGKTTKEILAMKGRERITMVTCYDATFARLVADAGVDMVLGHVGLTPQSVHAFGGHKIQGREPDRAAEILEEAKRLEGAGCFCVVLEGMPATLAARITSELRVPTIGIGAGPACDGQVLVL